MIAVGSTLFFAIYDNTSGGPGLWKSDGTAAGTVLVRSGYACLPDRRREHALLCDRRLNHR